MKNKILALFLTLCFIISSISAYAADILLPMGYSIGDKEYSLDLTAYEQADRAVIDGSGISLSSGGYAQYNFYLPFHCRSVKVSYKGSGSITIDSGVNTYKFELSDSGEYVLNFAQYLGREIQNFFYVNNPTYAEREYVERSGEREFKISASADVTITSMIFEKEKTPSNNGGWKIVMPDVSDEVLKTVSTVLIDMNSPIIQVNGGRRYIDNENLNVIPYNNEGTLYLPINTLCKALGYYHESIPEKGYVMIRSNTHEVVLLGNKVTVKRGYSSPEELTVSPIIYKDGEAWAAVRYFAELAGNTVGYKDGLVVIDDKHTVKSILNDSKLYNYAKDVFVPFKEKKTEGKTYYVAQTEVASDINNGSALAPFRTLEKAGKVAKAGDTVIIREGIYRETFAPLNDGTNSNPITFRAAEGEKVVISANEKLSNFANYKDNIYVTPMTWDLGAGRNQIFIGEESMTEARYPNSPQWREEGLSNMWPIRGDLYAPDGDRTVIRSDTLLNQPDNYWKGGYFVGLFSTGYALSTAEIVSSKKGELSVGNTSENWWPSNDSTGWNYGSIVGHINALDIPGEWVKQQDVLYMIFPEGNNPETTTVEAKKRQLVIDIADRKFINIVGIDTIGGGIRMNNSEMCMLNGMEMKYISHFILSNDQREGFIDRPYNGKNPDGAPPRGEVGVFIGGTDNVVVNCHIDHSAGAGIYGIGTYTYVENNVLNDCGYMGSYVSGITFATIGYEAKEKARGGHAVFNNTVYNCGRSCFNVSMSSVAQHYAAPFLPMEVAYNDFHDGILTSLDTGLIYEYVVNLGLDKEKTLIHHNYVYTTASKADENPHGLGIYHDNATYGTYTYNNLMFNTEKDVDFSQYALYQQSMENTPAYHDIWANQESREVSGGPAGLTEKNFPYEQCFFAGALSDKENYLVNYNKIATQTQTVYYGAEDAVLSDGVILEDGIAKFTENGQYILFENVDFGEGADVLSLSVYGDKYYSNDVIDVIIGDFETGIKKSVTVQINAPDFETSDIKNVTLSPVSGIQNVYIEAEDFRSIGIGGFTIYGLSEEGIRDASYSAKIYGGEFSSYDVSQVVVDELSPKPNFTVDGDPINPMVNNTWPGTVLKYNEISFRENTDRLAIAAGSGNPWAGQSVEVYIDSMDSEPVARYNVNKTSWGDYTPEYLQLNRIVPKGRHDIYLKFPIDKDENGKLIVNKSSNLYYFGFLTVGAELPKIEKEDDVVLKVLGGAFNAEASIQNETMPFVARYVERPYCSQKGLTNTKPGTVAAYKNVNLSKEVSKMMMRYSSEAEFDNQTVEIRVGSLDSEPIAQFITKGKGWETFETETVDLTTPLAAGKYDVYISFGGTTGSDQTCKLHWFGFDDAQ